GPVSRRQRLPRRRRGSGLRRRPVRRLRLRPVLPQRSALLERKLLRPARQRHGLQRRSAGVPRRADLPARRRVTSPGAAATFQFSTFTNPSSFSVGTDKTIYSVQNGGSVTVTAWDPATFSGPAAPTAYAAPTFAPVILATGAISPLPPFATIV